jgi:hypothetical protein
MYLMQERQELEHRIAEQSSSICFEQGPPQGHFDTYLDKDLPRCAAVDSATAAIRGSCVYSLDLERTRRRHQEAQAMVEGVLRQMNLQ